MKFFSITLALVSSTETVLRGLIRIENPEDTGNATGFKKWCDPELLGEEITAVCDVVAAVQGEAETQEIVGKSILALISVATKGVDIYFLFADVQDHKGLTEKIFTELDKTAKNVLEIIKKEDVTTIVKDSIDAFITLSLAVVDMVKEFYEKPNDNDDNDNDKIFELTTAILNAVKTNSENVFKKLEKIETKTAKNVAQKMLSAPVTDFGKELTKALSGYFVWDEETTGVIIVNMILGFLPTISLALKP